MPMHSAPSAVLAAFLHIAPGLTGTAAPTTELALAPTPVPAPVPDRVWESLPPPDAADAAWLKSRVPGLDAASVRVMTVDAADLLLADAVARGLSPIDFFTEPVFRAPGIFFIPYDLLADVHRRYDIPVLTAASGVSTNGIRFHMRGLLIGQGRIDALYDWGPFSFANPEFDGDTYTLAARVSQRILGPGDLAVSGVAVQVGILYPVIQRIVKIGPGLVRVDTNLGSRETRVTPIVRR